MTDGTRLATDVYLPTTGGPRWPVRLVRTPYGRVNYNREYGAKAELGYVMVVQDMRGRFDSEGKDLAFIDCGWGDNKDGLDTINWILAQPWCNGKIGTEGASAMGITQCMLAATDPPGLVAQYIAVAAPSLYHHATYVSGALRAALIDGWLTGAGFDPDNMWLTCLHPFYDGHWRKLNSIAEAPRIKVPAVFFGGWYDVFLQGTIDGFVSRHNNGGPGAKGKQKLIIGPWGHGGPKADLGPATPMGELTYPPNSLKTPFPCGGDAWFEFYLKGVDTGVEKVPAVQYFTMGAVGEEDAPGNEWQTADNWPVPAEPTPFYLHVDRSLSRKAPETANGRLAFTYDPLDPVPTRGGCLLLSWNEYGTKRKVTSGTYDQRDIEQRPDVITFTTEPLAEPLEVTGRLTARLFVVSDRIDTDFAVKLTDVYPDGRSMNVTDGLARCRYRKGFDRLTPLEPGQPAEIEVDLWSTSMVFGKDHRIRVAVTGSNYPRFDVNPNTGWPAWPMGPTLKAHNQVLCDKEHPSCVILPVAGK
ncbi:MAG: CocE/NonD family hydrolase [Phycisphaerae bacterium]|nr:CocE/NonD family hydrolase [Phycisphaerae bacterium]